MVTDRGGRKRPEPAAATATGESAVVVLVPRRSDFDWSAPVLDAHGFVAPPRNTSSIPSSSRLALRAESSADTHQNHCGEVLDRVSVARQLRSPAAVSLLGCAP